MIGRKAKHHERASWRTQVWIQLKHYLQCVESIANQDAIDSTSMSTKPQISIYTAPEQLRPVVFVLLYGDVFSHVWLKPRIFPHQAVGIQVTASLASLRGVPNTPGGKVEGVKPSAVVGCPAGFKAAAGSIFCW